MHILSLHTHIHTHTHAHAHAYTPHKHACTHAHTHKLCRDVNPSKKSDMHAKLVTCILSCIYIHNNLLFYYDYICTPASSPVLVCAELIPAGGVGGAASGRVGTTILVVSYPTRTRAAAVWSEGLLGARGLGCPVASKTRRLKRQPGAGTGSLPLSQTLLQSCRHSLRRVPALSSL